jgi:hypothetical protein
VHGGVSRNIEEGMKWRGKWIEESIVKRNIPLLWMKRRSNKFCRRKE